MKNLVSNLQFGVGRSKLRGVEITLPCLYRYANAFGVFQGTFPSLVSMFLGAKRTLDYYTLVYIKNESAATISCV